MDETDDRGWPLHLRVASAALRAAVASLPALLFLLGGLEGLTGVALALIGWGWWFLLEQRDAGWRAALVRTPAAGLVFGLTAPFVVQWTGHALSGDPASGYAEMGRVLQRQAGELPLISWTVSLASCALLPLACVRATSDRYLPALAAGAAGAVASGLGGALALGIEGPRGEVLPVLLSVLLGFLPVGLVLATLTWLGDRLAARSGVAGPGPSSERGFWPIALWLALLSGLWWGGLIGSLMPRHGGEAAAIGALKTLNTSQSLFREGDEDEDGAFHYAGSLSELSAATLIDGVLGGGVKQGYLFRLVASSQDPENRWCAAADPIEHGLTGERRFFINHTGAIWFTTGEACPLDRASCQEPPGWTPAGGGG